MYNILSPDGIPIFFDKVYETTEEARAAFVDWKKRFEAQGYYSTAGRRIPLEELADYCELIEC